ncbi:probable serine/threonine-protein kinase pats1 [Ylistrum balloti]|uniref:probable serine/threonine-protein kinase pats1 n=1 Tax=Ylistrum balloti TaxID=509963 RepID=UPI002905F2EF|nr:probable serine/threonine-protein kinase pats1 [Ylistrum balloti]
MFPGKDKVGKWRVSEVTRQDESEEVYHQSRQQHESVAFMSMWDMGGDLAFQATNSVFISAHGVYIVTFRAIDYFTDNLQMVRLKNWVRNIGAYSSRAYNPNKLHPHHPPIIVVGTHMDQVNAKFKDETTEEKDKRLQNMRIKISSITELTKERKGEGFVFLRFCTVDNSISDDPAFEKIKGYILEAAEYQDQWERKLPCSWLALEREILKQRQWRHVLTLQDIKDMDSKCESPIGDEEKIQLFLEYLHSTRSVLYFRKYRKVIINPQWVINAFREILTDEKFLPSDDLLHTADITKYLQNAVLTVDLAKELWKLKEDNSYIQHIDILFAFLEEFGLLVKGYQGQDQYGNPVYDHDYTVPSKLQTAPDINQISSLLKAKGTVCSRTLCFVFEEVFTPQELFHRIYAGVIKKFRPAKVASETGPITTYEEKQIYKELGFFKVDDLCNMVVSTQWEQSVIAVTLYTTSEPRILGDTCLKVRQTMETIIQYTLELSRQQHLKYSFKLHCRFYLQPNDIPRDGDGIRKTTRGLPCQGDDCAGKHILINHDWFLWFPAPVTRTVCNALSGNTPRTCDSELLTDKGLQEKVAARLGINWESVMTSLGVQSYQLDRIKLAHQYAPLTQITSALIHWRDTYLTDSPEEEMLKDLSKAFRQFGVDSDVIDQELEIFTSN